MAFAVKDVESSLGIYVNFLNVPAESKITHFQKSGNKVAVFYLGDIEYQLCESVEENGRFATWIRERGAEGLHHLCYEVENIDHALAHAVSKGAELRICQACGVFGSHAHPEGYVAFLDDEVGGVEIEYMQVYTEDELENWNKSGTEVV